MSTRLDAVRFTAQSLQQAQINQALTNLGGYTGSKQIVLQKSATLYGNVVLTADFNTLTGGFGASGGLFCQTAGVANASFPSYYSSLIDFRGNVWDLGAAAARVSDWQFYNLPVAGNPPTSYLALDYSYNNAAFANRFKFYNNGIFDALGFTIGGSALRDALGLGPRQSTIVIAASDSPNKVGADLICSGTADQVTINNAIASVGAFTQAAKIFLRCGTYNLTDTIVIDRSFICLEGEHSSDYADFVTPRSEGAKLVMGTSGKAIITINTAAGIMIGTTITRLLLVGNQTSGNHGVTMVITNGTDLTQILDCVIFQCDIGINMPSIGLGVINRNSIQECNSAGIVVGGNLVRITDNIIFGTRDYGIAINNYIGYNNIIANNTIGSVIGLGYGIADLGVGGNIICGNTIGGAQHQGQILGSGILIRDDGHNPSDDVITGNYIAMTENSTGDGITVGVAGIGSITDHHVITGNRIVNESPSATTAGYAIRFSSTAHGCIANGNVIEAGRWNGGSQNTILWGDPTNAGHNVGDSFSQSWTNYIATSDATTNGQVLTNVTGLVTGTLIAGASYEFEAKLRCTTSAVATGTQYGVHCSSAPTAIDAIFTGPTTVAANQQTMLVSGTNADGISSGTYLTTASEEGEIVIKGHFVVNAAAAFSIQHLKVTSGTSTVKAGSVLRLKRVA